ncbi:hypothetical protein TWF694_003792 [Orbilia ellipsospora]|uniref:Methyltransferase domain-containing protein n=1 Tax=Orbilia ellipsospora TaxID=2528407 RepID=A0AAV9X587_9PEZI
MPPLAPLSFGDKAYWESRFTDNPEHFDWLVPAPVLLSSIQSALSSSSAQSPEILHIGCGTSELSFHLRNLVSKPMHVSNVDFSLAALQTGNAKEEKIHPSSDPEQHMKWMSLDLLSHQDVVSFRRNTDLYDVIVDKSTSDAISCAEYVTITLPYPITASDIQQAAQKNVDTARVHPMAVLLNNLAYLAKPNAKWLVLSYSSSRFAFMSLKNSEASVIESIEGLEFTDPRLFWRIANVETIDAPEEHQSSHVVGRPAIKLYLYILERTSVEAKIHAGYGQAKLSEKWTGEVAVMADTDLA